MKAYRTNKWLYIALLLTSILMITVSLFIPNDSKCFAIISGIGGGWFASVLVAWLIDMENCRTQNNKYSNLARFAYGELQYAIADYCEQYCEYCCGASPLLKQQNHTFGEWSDLYVALISTGVPQAKKTYVLSTIENVRDAYRAFYRNRLIILDLNLLTEDEYKKMAEVSHRIIMMQGQYMISDIKVNPELIKEANDEIAELLLEIPHFSKIAKEKYSYSSDSWNVINDDMDITM